MRIAIRKDAEKFTVIWAVGSKNFAARFDTLAEAHVFAEKMEAAQ